MSSSHEQWLIAAYRLFDLRADRQEYANAGVQAIGPDSLTFSEHTKNHRDQRPKRSAKEGPRDETARRSTGMENKVGKIIGERHLSVIKIDEGGATPSNLSANRGMCCTASTPALKDRLREKADATFWHKWRDDYRCQTTKPTEAPSESPAKHARAWFCLRMPWRLAGDEDSGVQRHWRPQCLLMNSGSRDVQLAVLASRLRGRSAGKGRIPPEVTGHYSRNVFFAGIGPSMYSLLTKCRLSHRPRLPAAVIACRLARVQLRSLA
ncbi:hypothetical protein WOLCODRAFT_17776 [Wolfiporia cocos MD-104 SS10]|uniref:Uncharacterized protein n=1 Tax=Wolfiporia cocos (strain MD-104) TaxID=742152 RepID=A0A2H3JLX4_WOLCO|nr:hypothetical protein WOLCODRAFT_17776 [Wolfiporia cocos MD-104 SS10]